MPHQYVHSFRRHWTELERAGVPLGPLESRCRPGGRDFDEELLIEQQGELAGDCIIESDSYFTCYMLDVRVISRLSGAPRVLEPYLRLPWIDDRFEWLSDPADGNPSSPLYTFPGKSTPDYPREIVMNHRIKKPLSRGAVREGLMLGRGWAPIPEAFHHGAEIDVTLTFLDQWPREYRQTFVLWIDRSAIWNKPARRKRVSIFSNPDPTPTRRPSMSEPVLVGKATINREEKLSGIESHCSASP
jgi:hypothetical protein